MLSPDHVVARRRGKELQLTGLGGPRGERALRLAESLLAIAEESVGATREDFGRGAGAIPIEGADGKLADGLRKLVEDACEFTQPEGIAPQELRSELFLAASAARRDADEAAPFQPDEFATAFAAARDLNAADVTESLYADLKGSHTLTAPPRLKPQALLERYELAQRQAVLIRASKVIADVRCADAYGYRALFRKLKFRRLLFKITPLPKPEAKPKAERDVKGAGAGGGDSGYRIEIDGPFSLFESVTKYGLQLALLLPELEKCEALRLKAELRWGKRRERLEYTHESRGARSAVGESGADAKRLRRKPALSDDLVDLIRGFESLGADWDVKPAMDIVALPGVGLCVPDLAFTRSDGKRVLFELMGFWSRDAVWKRVELAKAGLPTPILFAVSSRLRVSEAVLDDEDPGALIVFKGVLRPNAVLEHLERLADGPAQLSIT